MSDLGPIDPRITEIVQAAIDGSPKVTFEPGTYEGIDQFGDGIVRLDSQQPNEPGAVHATIIGPQPNVGARVVVAYVPPMSAYVLGEVMIAPIGGELQPRVLLDSPRGQINFYNPEGLLVGRLSAERWFAGVESGGPRAQLDPFGGLRIFDHQGLLMGVFDASGIQIRDANPTTGIVHANINDKGAVFTADDGKQIHLIPSQTGNVVVPKWAAQVSQSPGASGPTPALVAFAPSDLELRYTSFYDDVSGVPSTFTPPSGMTEVFDVVGNATDLSLGVSLASLQPGSPASVKSFTQSQTGMLFHNGHTLVVKANPTGSAPSIRATSQAFYTFNTERMTITHPAPAGTAAGDLLLAFVSMGNRGGFVPTTWSVPEGFQFSGAVFKDVGAVDTLGSGVWYKQATGSEPANYDITIQVAGSPTSTKRFHVTIVSIQNPGTLVGGSDIQFQPQSAVRVYTTVNTNFPAIGSAVVVDFNNKSYDPGVNYDLTNNRYLVPATGPYKVGFQLETTISAAGESFRANVSVYDPGPTYVASFAGSGSVFVAGFQNAILHGHDVIYLTAGQLVSVDAIQETGSTTRAIAGLGSDRSFFYIKRDLST